MEGQDKFVMRELENADVGLWEDCEEDLGCNADLYVANQESDSIHEVHVGDALFAFNGNGSSQQDLIRFRSLSLD